MHHKRSMGSFSTRNVMWFSERCWVLTCKSRVVLRQRLKELGVLRVLWAHRRDHDLHASTARFAAHLAGREPQYLIGLFALPFRGSLGEWVWK